MQYRTIKKTYSPNELLPNSLILMYINISSLLHLLATTCMLLVVSIIANIIDAGLEQFYIT